MRKLSILWIGLTVGFFIPTTLAGQGYGQSIAVGDQEIFCRRIAEMKLPLDMFLFTIEALMVPGQKLND